MTESDEFFIGWQGKAPAGVGRFLRRQAMLLVGIAVVVAVACAALQATIGHAWFEFGKVRDFSGVLLKAPVPMLIAAQPDEASGALIYYLVNPLKFGFDQEVAEELHLKTVSLRGTLVHREDGRAMIEVVPGSASTTGGGNAAPLGEEENLGRMTLAGEIVDSKCYLGVMNPGIGKPHRACAIRCISGGIPPVLLVKNAEGEANYFILVDAEGGSVNAAVLDFVALPVEITGEVTKLGDRLILKASPSEYKLLTK